MVGMMCLLLGVTLVTQFRTQRLAHQGVPVSASDQATYISQLYENNTQLRQQVDQLSREIADYEQDSSGGKSNLDTLVREWSSIADCR